MPVKRRLSKGRRYTVSPEAAARWRQVRPDCLLDGFVGDFLLGELVGEPALLAMYPEDARALFEALEDAIDAA